MLEFQTEKNSTSSLDTKMLKSFNIIILELKRLFHERKFLLSADDAERSIVKGWYVPGAQ